MFFVERASQIMDLINAIIDAIATIASGSANAAAAIENALARSLPVAISFLASILGLGDISDKIKSILKKIQAPINKAIEWVLNLAKKTVGAIKGFLGGGKDKDKSQDKDGKEETAADPQVEEQAQAGFAAINAEEQKYMEDDKISKENAEKLLEI